MKKAIFILLALFAFAGCTNTTQPPQKSNLSVGMAKKNIVEGVTTQTQVLELFGAPNLITTSTEGKEVWTYNKSSYEKSGSGASTGVLIGLLVGNASSAVTNASTASLDLIITFNKRGIVEKYKVISSAY